MPGDSQTLTTAEGPTSTSVPSSAATVPTQPRTPLAGFFRRSFGSPAHLLIIVTFVFAFGVAFWPTLYRYDHLTAGTTTVPVRFHRITGRTEVFRGRWVPEPAAATAAPYEILSAITGRGGFSDLSRPAFSASLYNGSSWQITEVTVRVVAKQADGTERWTRDFTHDLFMAPRSTGELFVLTGETAPGMAWALVGAKGHPPEAEQ